MAKKVPKGAIKGFTIVGSKVRGTRKLLFKTRREATEFKLGGRIRPAFRTTRVRKPRLI
jgi:hypothetical protein